MIITLEIMKTFRYRLCPDEKQEKLMRKFAGASRFIYNWGLARWTERYGQVSSIRSQQQEFTVR